MDKYRVTLTRRSGASCNVGLHRQGRRTQADHARILLLADATSGPGHSDQQITDASRPAYGPSHRVRQRFVIEGIEAAVNRSPQPPRPDKIKIKGDIEQRLVQLACSDPPRADATGPATAGRRAGRAGHGRVDQHETVRRAQKNDIKQWIVEPGASRSRPTQSTSGAWRT